MTLFDWFQHICNQKAANISYITAFKPAAKLHTEFCHAELLRPHATQNIADQKPSKHETKIKKGLAFDSGQLPAACSKPLACSMLGHDLQANKPLMLLLLCKTADCDGSGLKADAALLTTMQFSTATDTSQHHKCNTSKNNRAMCMLQHLCLLCGCAEPHSQHTHIHHDHPKLRRQAN